MNLQPLTVVATVPTGIASAAPWGVALDGILASALYEQVKADADQAGRDRAPVMTLPDPPDLDLPLARCTDTQTGLWHWAATCAFPLDDAGDPPDVQYWMSRHDQRATLTAADSAPNVVSDTSGRYRRHHQPLLVTVCTKVAWRAVGDLDTITELLTPIWSIGKKRHAGSGRVTSWQITPSPELDEFTAGHLHPDGTLARPTPTGCLTGHGDIPDGGYGLAGLRPPYIHPARQHHLHLPALLA